MIKFKQIMSLLLVSLLLAPTLVKFEHHHEHFICKAVNEKHLHDYHKKCQICNFEFSLFQDTQPSENSVVKQYKTASDTPFKPFYFSDYSKYSFLLRAPPCSSLFPLS